MFIFYLPDSRSAYFSTKDIAIPLTVRHHLLHELVSSQQSILHLIPTFFEPLSNRTKIKVVCLAEEAVGVGHFLCGLVLTITAA